MDATNSGNLPCEHGRQRRKCEICELETVNEALTVLESSLASERAAHKKAVERIAELEAALAAAEERGARSIMEMLLNEGVLLDYGSNVGRESPTDAIPRWLAARKGE